MPPIRIRKKVIAKEKEFNTGVNLSDYGVTDVNDVNQLRTFMNNNARDPFLAKTIEYTKYRIAALSEIDKRSQELKNPKTGKLSKVIIAGKEVDKVEGHPDVTDCFIMDNINQESKQTSANGCWSVSMSLLLQSRGVDLDQQMIRSFKPTGEMKYYNDKPMAVEDYMHLIEKTTPNTGLRSRMITSKENFARLSNIGDKSSKEYLDGVAHVADNFKAVVDESLRVNNSAVSITDKDHVLTVVGTGKKNGKDGFFYKDSLGPDEPNKTYFKTYEEYINERLANPIPENALKSIQCTFLQDFEITKEKDSDAKTCDQVTGFPGLKFEDGKIKPGVIGADGKEGYGEIKEGGNTYLILEPAESGATKGNTIVEATNGDVVETIYFPSKIEEGSPYLSEEAMEQEKAAEEEFEKPATSALFRSDTYSDYMKSVSDELESEQFFAIAGLDPDSADMVKFEKSMKKLSYGNAINNAMSHLRDVYGFHENLKGLLSNKESSQKAEEAADDGLAKAMKAAADSLALFLRHTSESRNSEFYGRMNRLYNKLNGLVEDKSAVDAELEMYKNAYVRENDVKLTNDLDKDIEDAEVNIVTLENQLADAEKELATAEQVYVEVAADSEKIDIAEVQEEREKAENLKKAAENAENDKEEPAPKDTENNAENPKNDEENIEDGEFRFKEFTTDAYGRKINLAGQLLDENNRAIDVDQENERLDKAIEASTKALDELFTTLDAVEARLGVPYRDRYAFLRNGQDMDSLAARNLIASELSADERKKLEAEQRDLKDNKIEKEFETLRNLQDEKDKLNKNQNLEDVNAFVNELAENIQNENEAENAEKNEETLQNTDSRENLERENVVKENATNENVTEEEKAKEGNDVVKQVKEEQANKNIAKNEASDPALENYNKKKAEVSDIRKKLEDAKKHRDTLLATKKQGITDLKNEALSKRNDAILNASSGLLGLAQGLERVDRKFPFFKVGRNKNSEEFENLHSKIWEIQNKLTPELFSKNSNNKHKLNKDYVLDNRFYNDLQDLKENAQKYVAHIATLSAGKGKEGPSSEVGKQRLALAKNVIAYCDQMSQSYEKRDALEKLSENDITRKANRNLQPYNLRNDFSNDAIEDQKKARDEKARKDNDPSLYGIIKNLFSSKKKHLDVKDILMDDFVNINEEDKNRLNEEMAKENQAKDAQANKEEQVNKEDQANEEKPDNVENQNKEEKKEEKNEQEVKKEEKKLAGKASDLDVIHEVDEELEQEAENEEKLAEDQINNQANKEEKSDSEVAKDFAGELIKDAANELAEEEKQLFESWEIVGDDDKYDFDGLVNHKLLPDDELEENQAEAAVQDGNEADVQKKNVEAGNQQNVVAQNNEAEVKNEVKNDQPGNNKDANGQDLDAGIANLEDEIDRENAGNNKKNNFFDREIARLNAHEKGVNDILKQGEDYQNEVNRIVDANQPNPVAPVGNEGNVNEQNNNLEANNQRNAQVVDNAVVNNQPKKEINADLQKLFSKQKKNNKIAPNNSKKVDSDERIGEKTNFKKEVKAEKKKYNIFDENEEITAETFANKRKQIQDGYNRFREKHPGLSEKARRVLAGKELADLKRIEKAEKAWSLKQRRERLNPNEQLTKKVNTNSKPDPAKNNALGKGN